MKFSCTHCNKKYGISDEKLKKYKAVFKMRCQDCKNIISVNNPFYEKDTQKKWYIYLNKKQTGPFTFEELKKFSNQELNYNTLVWKTGFKEWQKASKIPELLKIISNQKDKKIKSIENLSKLYESSKNQIEKKNLKEELALKRLNTIKQREKLNKLNTIKQKEELNKQNTIKQEKINNIEKEKIEKERLILQQEKQEIERLKRIAIIEKEKAEKEAKEKSERAEKEARLAKEEVRRAKEEIEKLKQENVNISADEFFNDDFEEEKTNKKSKLLKTVGSNHVMGNTGIFIMYKQSRIKERIGFIIIISILLVVGIAIIVHLNKKPKTITKIETKTEYKTKIVKEKEIEYVEVESKNRTRSKKYHKKQNQEVKTKENQPNNINKTKENKNSLKKKENSMYGERNLGTKVAKLNIKKTDNEVLNDLKNKPYHNRVASVVNDSKKGLFWCYRKELKNSPDIIAKAYFNLRISSSGRVISVENKFKPQKYNNSNMASCMTRKIKNWKFPNNPNGEEIKFKFSIALKSN